MKTSLKVTKDIASDIQRVVQAYRYDEVRVGIPESEATRDQSQEDDGQITNAAILAIAEFGSPANNIPPRPVVSTGIRNAQAEIAEQFKKAAKDSLTEGQAAIDRYYERAGIIGATSIKKAINDQDGIEPPSEATLRSRAAKGFKGTSALLVTGQMRNAITSVTRRKA